VAGGNFKQLIRACNKLRAELNKLKGEKTWAENRKSSELDKLKGEKARGREKGELGILQSTIRAGRRASLEGGCLPCAFELDSR
jgi:hypothetical protein